MIEKTKRVYICDRCARMALPNADKTCGKRPHSWARIEIKSDTWKWEDGFRLHLCPYCAQDLVKFLREGYNTTNDRLKLENIPETAMKRK